MILILQVMTKIIFLQEFQNLTPPSYLTQHFKQKTILLSTSRHLTLLKNVFLQ